MGSGVSLNFRFCLYSSRPIGVFGDAPHNSCTSELWGASPESTYNSEVGRLRIKKKEAVIPFRETLAYRMMLLAGSVIVCLVALYIMIGALQVGITVSFVTSGVITAAGAFGIFYNADHLRDAKIPK